MIVCTTPSSNIEHEGSFGLVKSLADMKVFDALYVSLKEYLHAQAEVKESATSC
jgi:hypothetical protein